MRRLFPAVLAAALGGAVALGPVVACAQAVPQSQAQIALSFAPVVRAVTPAVVNIYARRVVEERLSPFAGDPFFDQFFRDFGQGVPRVQNSLGSGVIVSGDGLVVSNYHVVGMATEITVVLTDRREFAARVVLADEASDLAVLRIDDARGLPSLAFRDSDGIEVGELVLAVGNPFGIGQTVSMGIVSGLARSALSVGDGRGYFLQTDAAINPGNSGGALVDVDGRLVGINTAILSRSGGSNGIGFAIPANLVRSVVEQAAAGASRFVRPWAGVTGQAVDAALAEALGLERPEGVALSDLHPASPFRAAGLRAGDVVLALGAASVNSPQEMMFHLSARGVGGTIAVRYLRAGRQRGAEVMLVAPPDDPPRAEVSVAGDTPLRGLRVAFANPAVVVETGLPAMAEGRVVVVSAEGYAAQAGLRPGDVLLAINGSAVDRTADVERLARSGARNWTIDLVRGGDRLRLRFRV